MSDWNRSTRECYVQGLAPELRQAIQGHLDRFRVGPILDDALLCVETTSVKKKKGPFGGGAGRPVVVSAILTPRWLVWAVKGEKANVSVLSAQLKEALLHKSGCGPGDRVFLICDKKKTNLPGPQLGGV